MNVGIGMYMFLRSSVWLLLLTVRLHSRCDRAIRGRLLLPSNCSKNPA